MSSATSKPKLQRRFADRVIEAVLKTRAAMDLGPAGFALLVAVLHIERDSHFRLPVLFFHSVLQESIGVTPHVFIKARNAAIKDGWLIYEQRDRHRGTYFVTIPGDAQEIVEDMK